MTFDAGAALARRAAERPSDLAVLVDGGAGLTFAAWARRSRAVAAGLAERGIGAGDRVALRFDAERWAGFAVAYVGVLRVGGVAVLVPAGLSDPDASRIVRHSEARGVLCPVHLAGLAGAAWTADPADLVADDRPGPEPRSAAAGALAELVYPATPFTRPRPLARTCADLAAPSILGRPGRLVHSWAPGSLAGQQALVAVLSGPATAAATLARFSPEALVALVARLAPSTVGLTPGLAAALVDSGAAAWSPVGSVTAVVLSGPARPGTRLRSDLAVDFPRATVDDLDEPPAAEAGDDADPPPVGASQVGMLWHEQLAPGSFNLPSLVRRYRGALDVPALGRSLAELVRRHEPLRTTFEVGGGQPRQVVRAGAPDLPVDDLSGLPPAERHAAADRIIAEAGSRPFDLVEDPLFAPRLLRLGPDDHVLVVRLHHTAFDDWSVDVFRRELSALYPAFLHHEPSPLPEPATRFVDACRRQRTRLAGGEGERQRAAWRDELAGAPMGAQLALGDGEPGTPPGDGAAAPVRHDLPPALARSVRALARDLRATPFMAVLAAFEVLLARRTRQEDLVIASVVAARGSTDLEPMIGCFTKKVLLRLRLDGDPTFAEVVARTRGSVLGALASPDLPFEAVVDDTLGPRAAAHGLMAQVPIVFQGETPQLARLVLPGLELGPYEVPASARSERHFAAPRSAADGPEPRPPPWGDGAYLGSFLIVSLLEPPDGLGLVARGVFAPPAARRLLEELEVVLGEATADPGRPVSALAAPAPPQARPTDADPDADVVTILGVRAQRSRLEAALAGCPGVADVAVAVLRAGAGEELVAYVVADRRPPPSLARLRQALWSALPGSVWPAAAVVVEAIPRLADGRPDLAGLAAAAERHQGPPDPQAALITALWADAAGREVGPATSYWQDFSFLSALAQARAAGLAITDRQVARCRTPEMLGAALAAESG